MKKSPSHSGFFIPRVLAGFVLGSIGILLALVAFVRMADWVKSNDNWRSDQEVELIASTISPANDLEAALVTTLSGNGANYTAIVRGAGGATGIAVVEVYAVD